MGLQVSVNDLEEAVTVIPASPVCAQRDHSEELARLAMAADALADRESEAGRAELPLVSETFLRQLGSDYVPARRGMFAKKDEPPPPPADDTGDWRSH
jgi:hypothetical protein